MFAARMKCQQQQTHQRRWNGSSLRSRINLLVIVASLICSTMAAPIRAPDVRICRPPLNFPPDEISFNCCAPSWDKPAIRFQLNDSASSSLRVRQAAQNLDEASAKRLNEAYRLMKALPPEDPRSFGHQANIHCAYCNGVYNQGNTSIPYEVHASWLFFSFHRWYLYFHERILAKLLDDDTFALPFWNYDSPLGDTIPSVYMEYEELTDRYREPSHLPPTVTMLDYYYMNASIRTSEEQRAANANIMYRMVVSGATTQYRFFGQPYRSGDDAAPGFGTIETMPHNSMHGWTGDSRQIGKKDMGTLYAAGRDPVFYAHHASLDRYWEVWRSLEGNEDIDDPDYLEAEMVFYNEEAELVIVNVRDSLSTEKLGFVYEEVENVWLNATPVALSKGVATMEEGTKRCELGEELLEVCTVVVLRDKVQALYGEETLVIAGITGERQSHTRLDFFLNLPSATSDTMLNCTEYAGTFWAMPQLLTTSHKSGSHHLHSSSRLGIRHNIRDLGLTDQDHVLITVVPRTGDPFGPVSVSDVRIEYEAATKLPVASSK